VQQERPLALLSVAGELSAGKGQIADAGLLDGARTFLQRPPNVAENKAIGRADVAQCRVALIAEDESVEETTAAEQDRAAAAGATQNRDGIDGARGLVHVFRQPAAGAEHHSGRRPLPDA